MHRIRSKICGLTRVEDVQLAVEAGADALGFVFYPPSSRAVSVDQAEVLLRSVPPFVMTVALFVNPDPQWLAATLKRLPFDLLQFHGDEDEGFCQQFDRPYIKALRMKPGLDPCVEADKWPSARGFLLDAYQAGTPGGTGEQFDWQRFPKEDSRPWILAGGLTAQNLQEAVQITRPYAVDVSGGVEAQRGIKCPIKMNEFIRQLASSCQSKPEV